MEELLLFLLWCTVTPGKKSETITPLFNRLFVKHKPSELIRSPDNVLLNALKGASLGQYKRLLKCWKTISDIKPLDQLTKVTRNELTKVPGIGPKTASKLINEFGSFEGLLANQEKISNERIKNLIHDHEEKAKISHQLVILKNDLELPITIEKLKDFEDSPKLNDFFKKYEFKSLIRNSAHETKPHAAKKNLEFKILSLLSFPLDPLLRVYAKTCLDLLIFKLASLLIMKLSCPSKFTFAFFVRPSSRISILELSLTIKGLADKLCGSIGNKRIVFT